MITDREDLKCSGQWPKERHASAMRVNKAATSEKRHQCFRWDQVTWSGPGAERAEHAANASCNSCTEKGTQSRTGSGSRGSRKDRSTARPSAALYVPSKAAHRSPNSLHGVPRKEMASWEGRLRLRVQAVRSHGLRFSDATSWIRSSKKSRLAPRMTRR